jgi:hypothetical protein
MADVLSHEKYLESRLQYVERMSAEGYSIYQPEDNELLLDLDTEEDFAFFQKAVARLQEEYPLWGITWFAHASKSGLPHRHAIVNLGYGQHITSLERVAYQAVLGSDRVRELLSLFRYFAGDPCPTLLAEKTQ